MANRKTCAIIIDGNGRLATQRGWPRLVGHRRGAERVKEIVTACPDMGGDAFDCLCVFHRKLEAQHPRSSGTYEHFQSLHPQ